MMARLLTDDTSAPNPGPGMCETGKAQNIPARKLSFKTRQASSRGGNYRSTKVSLSSSNVALIASKFNTIVIDDEVQGRALLRKLSGNQRKPSISKDVRTRPVKKRAEGVVKAAIEIFEHHESDKTKNGKPPVNFKKGNDSRPKLIVVKKSLNKSTIGKSDDVLKIELSNECAKVNSTENKNEIKTMIEVREVKRKPSLKAKPVQRYPEGKLESATSLNQRITKFDNIDLSKKPEKSILIQDIRKPTFSLNERIAQFDITEESKTLDDKNHNVKKKYTTVTVNNNKKVNVHFEEKENEHENTKSILRSTKNRQLSLIDQTKDRLATIIQQTNNTNQQHTSNTNTDKKHYLTKDKFIAGEKKELKVFQCVTDIINVAELKDEGINNKLSMPKNVSVLDNAFRADRSSQPPNSEEDIFVHSLQSSESSGGYYKKNKTVNKPNQFERKESAQNTSTIDSSEDKTTKIRTALKDEYAVLKPSVKSYSSESPKLEKKTLCMASDPSGSLQLDKIKPNSSFLWKPSSRMSVVTEVPIYDDSPENHNNNNKVFDRISAEIDGKENCHVHYDDSKPLNSLDFDVANSFILEMTEQIERRFSSGSAEDKEFNGPYNQKANENLILMNSSFLHNKSSHDDFFTNISNLKTGTNITYANKNEPDVIKIMDVLPLVSKKPTRISGEDSPPQLPEKRPKVSGELDGNLNQNPPPIPPPHTKPKVSHTLSEETWLNNCKKILEIPPPLRRRDADENCLENTPEQQSKRTWYQCHSQREKRFSVSQVELLKKMSEMNLTNKRNSLPANTSPEQEEEDHYSTIQQFEKNESEDQDTYEAIGENNYAEIMGADDKGDTNIYDDVIGQGHQEDHYEAINYLVVQGDSDSSCDQSNSLYGLARPATLTVPGSVYAVTGGSETSDEWVDLDNSDDQNDSIYIFREKERGRGLVATESWSVKVRRQWSRQAAEGNDGSEESVPRSYENIENSDETSYYDDFDDSFSDSSFEHEAVSPHAQVVEEKRTQPLTEGIYGFMKQAGQRMRKHWTLGKSLTRMRKKSSPVVANAPANLGRRSWSFKSKGKLSTAQSTFYVNSTKTLSHSTNSQPEMKVDPRRLSTASMVARPTSPPPPPPPPRNSVDESRRRKSDVSNLNTSTRDNEGYVEGQRRLSRNGNSMWYIETSTDTASEHGSSQGSDLNLRFADEPLYQFYAANIAEMTLSELTEIDSDGYEEISALPSALDLVSATHNRTLWCEVSQVQNSGVLDTLTQSQKRLQEAKFEVMTSEASYFKSLTVLDKLFASCPLFADENILARDDRKVLFGNVNTVRKCSEKLLGALQACWQDCILLQGICDVVHDHVKTYQDVYVKYCTNQISMDRTLKLVKQTNSNFSTVLSQLETDSECQSLTLYSFLMLPMQRITRLRLLFDTMLSLLDPADSEFSACQRALETLNKCVMECNEGARRQERLEEMVRLSKQLEFPVEMNIPILGSNRWLVRSGQVTQVNMDAKQTFGRRLSRTGPKFTLFLFTDLFLMTKKKSEDSYLVVDHCQRSLLETEEIRDFPGCNRFLLQLTLLENADNKTVEITVSCENETDRQRWLQVLRQPQSEEPGEILYEGWDCPQVTTVHNYQPSQPDELPLALGDIINVLRKSEGWFFGERTRDGEKGWFPGNYTREIASKHVRARNLKQRHRLLQLSADFVQQQRKLKS